MKIKGFQPLTLSDYPSKVAAIVFTQGCNFRCPFCHNGDLLPLDCNPDDLFPEEDVLQKIAKRAKQLDALVITGGEPTLQHDLVDFARKVKALGLLVKLDSNGTNPKMLQQLIDEKLVDYIAMDIKTSLEKYHLISGVRTPLDKILKSIYIISSSGIDHQFRTTFVPALMDEKDLEEIRKIVPKNSLYIVQKFNPENALDESLREDLEKVKV